MKKFVPVLFILILLSGCAAPTSTAAPNELINSTSEITILPQNDAVVVANTPAQELSSGSLTARIFSQADATVNNVPFYVQGQANHKVVVTVNDAVFSVPAESIFSLPVSLEEGPNLIEVVMSDLDGNEVSFELTITYQP